MPLEVKIPNVGESVTEVTIASWMKEDGDYVEMDDVIAEIESDKASFELSAEDDGILRINAKEGDTVEVGQVIATIDTEAKKPEGAKKEEKEESTEKEAKQEERKPAESDQKKEETAKTYASGTASPAAAKILREKGISPADINGSGKDGRITKEDALMADKKSEEPQRKDLGERANGKPAVVELPQIEAGSRETESKKMTTLRKTIARRLVAAKNETAMLTTFQEVDMSKLVTLRKQYKEKFKEKHEIGLGFMSFFAKASCEALKEFPQVNAELDGDELIYHHYVDLGIAVSTDRGLVVPVIRNAESMTMAEIEKAVIHYAQKARENKISIEEMQGGTFTITNGGVFGSMLSTPILNTPQSAILGMHKIVERPVAVNGQVEIRPIMYLAVSYDHRVIDGRESVNFLYRIKEFIEDPARLLLGV